MNSDPKHLATELNNLPSYLSRRSRSPSVTALVALLPILPTSPLYETLGPAIDNSKQSALGILFVLGSNLVLVATWISSCRTSEMKAEVVVKILEDRHEPNSIG